MTLDVDRASRSTPDAPQAQTRRAARERERAAAAIARTAAEARAAARTTVIAGSPPIYSSRRALREAATRSAESLEVRVTGPTYAPPVVAVDAPALGVGGAHVPIARPARSPRPVGERQAPTRRPAAVRGRARSFARKATAGAALVFIGSLVVVTSMPAQAVQPPGELDPQVAQLEPETQSLDPVAADASTVFARDDIVVRDPLESALMSEGERAALQAVADSEPGGSYYGGRPAFPATWSMMETDYVQTPFPQVTQLPISSGFGYRSGGFHGGTDIPLAPGQEIRPVANGVVSAVWQGDNPGGGGYAVFVDHNIDGQFVQSWYPHMQAGSIRVEVGQVVDISTVLGGVGSTGRSTGPHLHLEMKNSDYVSFDPLRWLQTRETRLEVG